MNNILHFTDGYKLDHRRQYPIGTNLIYSNWTARASRKKDITKTVFFGLQYFVLKYLIKEFNESFFKQNIDVISKKYERRINSYLGENGIGVEHIRSLHSLGYLPLEIKALEEGSVVSIGIPLVTIKNTHPDFFWLTNYIETMFSATLWSMSTSATIAYNYRLLVNLFAKETSDNEWFTDFQLHDFSMRGMSSLETAMMSGAGHLLSSKGTDTLSSIDFLEDYYGANSDLEMIGVSVPATEHSVMCMGGDESEYETFKRIITETYPKGIVSIVSDTWNLWDVIDKTLPKLKEEIINRDGKVVIRPDSGNPIDILTGYSFYHQVTWSDIETNMTIEDLSRSTLKTVIKKDEDYYFEGRKITLSEYKGVIESLYDLFGGVVNRKGYKELDSHIGVIYGDGITLERAEEILRKLKIKGFSSTNIVFGVGSYTYQYNTRDSFYFAFKSTYGEINGEGVDLFKNPITDDGKKKSAKGLLKVIKNGDDYKLEQQVSLKEETEGELKTIFLDGKLVKEQTLSEIRTRLFSN